MSSHHPLRLPRLFTFFEAFLLENGALYHIAHSVALLEYLVTLYFKPEYKQYPYASIIGKLLNTMCADHINDKYTILLGIVVTLLGQVLRSVAMIHAGSNFSHQLAFRKVAGHVLVTGGIYRYTHQTYST